MHKLVISALVFASLTASATAADLSPGGFAPNYAPAKSPFGFYVEGELGVTLPQEFTYSSVDINNAIAPNVLDARVSSDNNFVFGGEAGARLSFGLPVDIRLGASLSYRNFNFDTGVVRVNGTPVLNYDAQGDAGMLTYLANAYLDIPVGAAMTAYVGAGIGGAHIKVSTPTNTLPAVNATKDVFAWALMAGANYNFTSNTYIGAKYRFLATNDFSIPGTADLTAFGGGVVTAPLRVEDLKTHEIMLTIGYRF